MIASSHQSSGPLPGPVPLQQAPALQAPAAAVNPDVPPHLVVDRPEPLFLQCVDCGSSGGSLYPDPLYPDPQDRRYTSGAQVMFCGTCVPNATPEQAVTAVVAAEMAKDKPVTPRDIAAAEELAGVTFDPQRVEAAAAAAREQARTEYAAELRERGEQLAVMTGFKRRLDAVLRLCEGRPDTDTMLVREIHGAAFAAFGTLDIPLTLIWDRRVDVPEAGAQDQRAIVECTTPHGGRAHLVLTLDERLGLASLLDASRLDASIVPDIHAPCLHSKACGTDNDLDPGDVFGWTRVQIGGLDKAARWYCTPACVSRALARAGELLAAIDDHAEDGGL